MADSYVTLDRTPNDIKVTSGYYSNLVLSELREHKTALQSMCPECLARFKVNVNKNRMSEDNQTSTSSQNVQRQTFT